MEEYSSDYDDEVLEELLDAFGSEFSLREIASAFYKADHNTNLAAEILYQSKECTYNAAITNTSSLEPLSEGIAKKPTHADMNSKSIKQKMCSVSGGIVSSFLGKGYSRSTILPSESCATTKPLKLNLEEFPMPELWENDASLDSTARNDPMHEDVEDFLYKMLGNGFQLGMGVIQEVLGCCGYDVKKSMEELIDLSASTLKKSDDIVGSSSEKFADKYPKSKLPLIPTSRRTRTKLLNQDKERDELQRQVLASLFNETERVEEAPRRTHPIRAVKKMRTVVVTEPPRDTVPELLTNIVEPQKDTDDDVEDEDNYQILRRSAKEHWLTMKEYYKTAVDALANGDHTLANKLLELGQFYNNKAREADEKSAQQILECRNNKNRDEVTLDLHDHGAEEAIRLLKFHLTSLSGIPDIQHLKVVVESGAEDITKGSRKRLILKLLVRESIKWTEEGNGGTILIQVDEIIPQRLSFAQKKKTDKQRIDHLNL